MHIWYQSWASLKASADASTEAVAPTSISWSVTNRQNSCTSCPGVHGTRYTKLADVHGRQSFRSLCDAKWWLCTISWYYVIVFFYSNYIWTCHAFLFAPPTAPGWICVVKGKVAYYRCEDQYTLNTHDDTRDEEKNCGKCILCLQPDFTVTSVEDAEDEHKTGPDEANPCACPGRSHRAYCLLLSLLFCYCCCLQLFSCCRSLPLLYLLTPYSLY